MSDYLKRTMKKLEELDAWNRKKKRIKSQYPEVIFLDEEKKKYAKEVTIQSLKEILEIRYLNCYLEN